MFIIGSTCLISSTESCSSCSCSKLLCQAESDFLDSQKLKMKIKLTILLDRPFKSFPVTKSLEIEKQNVENY